MMFGEDFSPRFVALMARDTAEFDEHRHLAQDRYANRDITDSTPSVMLHRKLFEVWRTLPGRLPGERRPRGRR